MHKYGAVFRINWQRSVEYRLEFVGNLIRGLITFAILALTFRAVFAQTDRFAGYSYSSIFTYLLMARVLHFTTRGNTAREIAREIREGDLSNYLLKPVSYIRFWFFSFLGDRLFEILIRFCLIAIFLVLLPSLFQFPPLSQFLWFLLFLIFSLFFNFLINLIMGSFAFWVVDIRLFSVTIGLSIDFLAGELIPLDLLPQVLKKIGLLLPFQYMMFFPIKIYQGSLSVIQIIQGMFIFLIWIGITSWFLRWLWQRGLKKYEASGR